MAQCPLRKPLILLGAQQEGKSWLMEDFAKTVYSNNAMFVNFMKNYRLRKTIETSNLDPRTLIGLIELENGKSVVPSRMFLVLNEIQKSRRANMTLKFFNEELPELAIVAAGSLLGLSFRGETKSEKKSFLRFVSNREGRFSRNRPDVVW